MLPDVFVSGAHFPGHRKVSSGEECHFSLKCSLPQDQPALRSGARSNALKLLREARIWPGTLDFHRKFIHLLSKSLSLIRPCVGGIEII